MGNINCTKQHMRDAVSEEIAVKSGLLLTSSEAYTVLNRRGFSDLEIFEGADDEWIRVRPEEVEELIRHLRFHIGDLPDHLRVGTNGSGKAGPPLILIQCKRHNAKNDVEIETVKAFWTDVHYEGAHRGLIATTSRIAPGGISVSVARRWPLGFAQHEQVSKWAKDMWRHSVLK